MALRKALTSSESDNWYTPPEFVALVEQVAPITLDPFPEQWEAQNRILCPDGFERPWQVGAGELVYCNPPYSRLAEFGHKFALEAYRLDTSLVALVPSRTDTRWFATMRRHAHAIAFLTGRIKFVLPDGTRRSSAPFASALFYAGPAPGRFSDVMTAAGHWAVML